MSFVGHSVFHRTSCQANCYDRARWPPPDAPTNSASAPSPAEETRERILDGLHDLLRERPDGSISVEQVAKRARVARSTVYLAFGSRRGLFDALTAAADLAVTGYGRRYLAAVRDPDARVSLRGRHRRRRDDCTRRSTRCCGC